ncbi:MAG: hypothetical protein OXC95_04715 [Dehalococcoidia bacterium]|nr:hypothetical protein [Dehalococcoidia bacterium]
MTDVIPEIIRLYLNDDIDLDTLEYRVILFAWDDDFEDQELLDEILFELIYIKDGVSDETIFRTRVAEIASQVPAVVAD